jgi:FkbM family methyltransferase
VGQVGHHEGPLKKLIFDVFRTVVRGLSGRGLGIARMPGANAVYEKLYALLRPADIVLVDVQGSKMYVKPDDSFISSSIINLGVWETEETALFYSLIKPGMTILDVGANMGYYTLLAAKLVGTLGHVYAFEPDPGNYQLIVRSARVNGYRNVTVFNKAVADEIGLVKLYLESTNWGHSLSAQNVNQPSGFVEVEQVTLDGLYRAGQLGKKIDFIKIDVQGAEELVVKGARSVIQKNKPTIVMELEPKRLRNMGSDALPLLRGFETWGYTIRAIESDADLPRTASLEDIVFAAEKLGVLNVLLVNGR